MSDQAQMVPQTDRPQPPQEQHVYFHRHHDDEYIDRITIDLVERWKESELSGDEWRFSTVLRFFRKGHEVWSKGFNRMETAVAALPWFFRVAGEIGGTRGENEYKHLPDENERCSQPGCRNTWAVEYKPKKFFSRQGYEKANEESSFSTHHVRFCSRHRRRGDCGLEDADSNYELVRENPNAAAEDARDTCRSIDRLTGMRCTLKLSEHAGKDHTAASTWTND